MSIVKLKPGDLCYTNSFIPAKKSNKLKLFFPEKAKDSFLLYKPLLYIGCCYPLFNLKPNKEFFYIFLCEKNYYYMHRAFINNIIKHV